MRVLKYGGIAIACAAIVVLTSFTLFLCSTWMLGSAPLVHTMVLTALSLCGSGVTALMEFSDRPRQRDSPRRPFTPQHKPTRSLRI
jgi:hypothetical protein